MQARSSLHDAPAGARKITRAMLRAAYEQVRESERAKRERANEVRETAWVHYTANKPYAWAFWRVGFASRFGERIARGADLTSIPGYDELAQEMGTIFPEYGGDDGTARLWDFLLSPYDPMPGKAAMMETARELAERWALQETSTAVASGDEQSAF